MFCPFSIPSPSEEPLRVTSEVYLPQKGKTSIVKSCLANLLITFGLICLVLATFLIWQRTTPRRLSFNIKTGSQSEKNISTSKPKTLAIRDLGIELPISPARIREGKWEASTRGVSYLATSPIPGETGNSILYGHNWPNLLGNLIKIKPGQEVAVLFNNGSVEKFMVKTAQVITPDQTSILNPSDDKRITLYTCAGFLDRKRFVVTAERLGNQTPR